MGLVILNLGQVTKTTSELHFLSKLPLQTNMRALSHDKSNNQQPLYMAGLQRSETSNSRHAVHGLVTLTTWPLRPLEFVEKHYNVLP
ncbi:hypothetical protein TNCV_3883521 [Trichonephila clavipes]|nr:hypothetical protein TNCV_3883521 [Trichonephila clavipes]